MPMKPPFPEWVKVGAKFRAYGELYHVRGIIDGRAVARRWRREKRRWEYEVFPPVVLAAMQPPKP